MYLKPLLIPVLIQAVLTFVVWLWMYHLRIGEMRRKKIDPQAVSSRNQGRQVLTDSAIASDHLMNQFEMPVLFYTAIFVALILMWVDPVLVALAWVYVALRIVHSLIHLGYNNVVHRFFVYFASCLVLMGIWGRLGWYILFF